MLAATLSDSAPDALHHPPHHDREQPHHDLHDAEVVQDGEQRRDEDDRRQHLKREDHPVAGPFLAENLRHDPRPHDFVAERPEHEAGADERKIEQPIDRGPERLEHALPDRGFQHQQRKDDLQGQPPGDRPQVDRPPVGRQGVGDGHDQDQAGQRLEPRHAAEGGNQSDHAADDNRRSKHRASRASYGARGGGTR